MSLRAFRKGIDYYMRGLGEFLASMLSTQCYSILDEDIARANMKGAVVRIVSGRMWDSAIMLDDFIINPSDPGAITRIVDREYSDAGVSLPRKEPPTPPKIERPPPPPPKVTPEAPEPRPYPPTYKPYLPDSLPLPLEKQDILRMISHAHDVRREVVHTSDKMNEWGAKVTVVSPGLDGVAIKETAMSHSTEVVKRVFQDAPPPSRALSRGAPASYVSVVHEEVKELADLLPKLTRSTPRAVTGRRVSRTVEPRIRREVARVVREPRTVSEVTRTATETVERVVRKTPEPRTVARETSSAVARELTKRGVDPETARSVAEAIEPVVESAAAREIERMPRETTITLVAEEPTALVPSPPPPPPKYWVWPPPPKVLGPVLRYRRIRPPRVPRRVIRKRVPVRDEDVEEVLETAVERMRPIVEHTSKLVENATKHAPVLPRDEVEMRRNMVGLHREVRRISEVAERPPVLRPLVITTVYGPEYVCPVCGSVWYSRADLLEHIRTWHPEWEVLH